MKVVVKELLDEKDLQNDLGECEFLAAGDKKGKYFAEIYFYVSKRQLRLSATYMELNKALSIFVVDEEKQFFSGMCRWEENSYFSFRIENIILEIYLEK